MDRLLNWPTIRRSPTRLVKLMERAGFIDIEPEEILPPAILFSAKAGLEESRKPDVSLLHTADVVE